MGLVLVLVLWCGPRVPVAKRLWKAIPWPASSDPVRIRDDLSWRKCVKNETGRAEFLDNWLDRCCKAGVRMAVTLGATCPIKT